jgi:hypothetical protein
LRPRKVVRTRDPRRARNLKFYRAHVQGRGHRVAVVGLNH